MCNFWKLAWLKTLSYLVFPFILLNKNSIFMNLPMYSSHFSKENNISSNEIKHFNNKVLYHNPFHVFRWFSKLGCILYGPSNFMTLNVSCKKIVVHLFYTYNWLCMGKTCLIYMLSLEHVQNIMSFIWCLYWYGRKTNHRQLGNLQRAFDLGSNSCFVFNGTFGMVLRPILWSFKTCSSSNFHKAFKTNLM